MNEKELNKKSLEEIADKPFFRQPYFSRYFAEYFEIYFPYAPPGMPQYFDYWEADRLFQWLNWSVKKTDNKVLHLYGTPDPNMFWIIGEWNAEVYWGKQNGTLSTMYVMQIIMSAQKIIRVKVQANPDEFLKAAGRTIPEFKMDMYDDAVNEYMEKHRSIPVETSKTEIDFSKELSNRRFENNVGTFFCGVEREKYRALETVIEDFMGGAAFVPGEMKKYATGPYGMYSEACHPEDERERAHAWMKASSPWYYRNPRGRIYPTDDKNIYFVESQGQGPSNWRGNGCDGHYHQAYFFYVEFADDGRLKLMLEVINPMNKYNGCNMVIPSFPYYL